MTNTNPKNWLVLIGISLAAIMVPIDYTIVNTCLALIQRDLNMSIAQLQWLMTGFGITFCELLTVMGRLADILGRRRLTYLGCIGFGLASLGAGLSHSSFLLIIMRVLQGIFGAIMFPAGSAIITDAFPKKDQGKVLGIYGACMGIGLAIGPVLGGIITGLLNWRWIFFINIPVIIISLLICIPVLRESKHPCQLSIDWVGMILLILSLASLVFAISMGSEYGWGSLIIISTFIIAILSITALILIENKVKDPLLPFHLFTNHGFQASAWAYSIFVGFSWVVIFLTPLYLHDVVGFNTLQTGLMLLPMTIMTIIFPKISGHLYDRFKASVVMSIMFSTTIIAYLLFLFFQPNIPYWFIILVFIIYGASWGMGNGVGTPLAISQLENNNDVGVVAGAVITILNIAGVIILAFATTIFNYSQHYFLGYYLQQSATSFTATQIQAIHAALANPDQAANLIQQSSPAQATILLALFKTTFADGFRIVIALLLLLTLIGLPFALRSAKFLIKHD